MGIFIWHQASFYQWLKANLADYGFFFPYSIDKGGVAPEPWHISHRQVANECLTQLSLTYLEQELSKNPILGQGPVMANLESIYNQYITNITSE